MMLHTAKPIKMPVNLDLSIVAPLIVVFRVELELDSRFAAASLFQYVGCAVWDAVKLNVPREEKSAMSEIRVSDQCSN